MTKEEYWNMLVEKNPSFEGDVVKITVTSLKKIVYQAHEKGSEYNDEKHTNNKNNLFNIFFGGKK